MAPVPRWLVRHREACPGRVSPGAAGRPRVRRLRQRVTGSFTASVLCHTGRAELIYWRHRCTVDGVLPYCLVQRRIYLNGVRRRLMIIAGNTTILPVTGYFIGSFYCYA